MKACVVVSVGFLLLLVVGDRASAQTAPDPHAPVTTQLEDLVVTGRRTEEQAETFVSTIGAPPQGRKLAVWAGSICVGSVGMAAEPASFMVNRVLDWANRLGLRTSRPGCDPNILIVSSDDADRTARELVRARPLDFDAGVSSSHRGRRALRDFQRSGRPVRWWHVSIPVDPDTGVSLVRQRGRPPFTVAAADNVIRSPIDVGDYGQITMASRLYDDSLDHMQSVVIVIDAAALEEATFMQLCDYVAMVALAQIDPAAAPSVPSILTLFNPDIAQEETLTSWDLGYLEALYGTNQRNFRPEADDRLIARGLARRLEAQAAQ
jgi:hypothetical protein